MECLALAQAFETYWAYYLQSGGQLFGKECREAASAFSDSLEELAGHDGRVKDPVVLTIGEKTNVEDIVHRLKKWAKTDSQYPYDRAFESRFMLFALFAGLKRFLIKELGLQRFPTMAMTSVEVEHSERFLRWKGHLPNMGSLEDLDGLIRSASKSPTIAVVGDIRRSQDLMTYTADPEDFSNRMIQFIERTRALIEKHVGFFDKFTGDGFICYFNEAICKAGGKGHIECFLSFVREEMEFCESHFQQWSRTIRKLPTTTVGLAIGADTGQVSFHDMQHHLVAVGQPIVWASRMASLGTANEVIVNNLLFTVLENRPTILFEDRGGETKAGESFLARSMKFTP